MHVAHLSMVNLRCGIIIVTFVVVVVLDRILMSKKKGLRKTFICGVYRTHRRHSMPLLDRKRLVICEN
jgi:hypothetical protein